MDDTGTGDTGAGSERFRSKKLYNSGKYVYEDGRRSLNDATVRKTAKETGTKGISKILGGGDMHEGRIEDEDEGMAQRQPGRRRRRRRRQQKEELKGKN